MCCQDQSMHPIPRFLLNSEVFNSTHEGHIYLYWFNCILRPDLMSNDSFRDSLRTVLICILSCTFGHVKPFVIALYLLTSSVAIYLWSILTHSGLNTLFTQSPVKPNVPNWFSNPKTSQSVSHITSWQWEENFSKTFQRSHINIPHIYCWRCR